MFALAQGRDDAHWGALAFVSVEPASEHEVAGRKVLRPPTVHLTWGWRDRARGVERRDLPGGRHYTLTGLCTAEQLGALLPELLGARAVTLVGEASPDALPFVLAHEWPNLDRLAWADNLDAAQQQALRDRAPLLETITGATERAARAEADAVWRRELAADRAARAAAAAAAPVAPPPPPAAPVRPTLGGVAIDEMGEEVQLRLNFVEIERLSARLPAHVRRLRVSGGGLSSAEDLKVLVDLAPVPASWRGR